MSDLRIEALHCQYGSVLAVEDCNLTAHEGELVTLLGPSGSGKTTLLRAIAGYVRPSRGAIYIGNSDVTNLPPQRRNIGMVFQDYALFPHMRVFDNVAFGLRARRVPREEVESRVTEVLELVQLTDRTGRFPHELSGGQQQRVALARAIVVQPDLLLMDEPLGALDLKLRETVQAQIRKIQRDLKITTVYVTHDQTEAFAISDRIVVMNKARSVEVGAPPDLYSRPVAKFTAEFVGHVTLIPSDVVRWNGQSGTVRPKVWLNEVPVTGQAPQPGERLFLAVRPERVKCSREPGAGAREGRVTVSRFMGMNTLLTIEMGGQEVLALDSSGGFVEGDKVYVSWPADSAHLVRE